MIMQTHTEAPHGRTVNGALLAPYRLLHKATDVLENVDPLNII